MVQRSITLLALLCASTVLGAQFPAARQMQVIEELRELKFEGPVTEKKIERAQLRQFLEEQLEKGLPLPADEYIRTLRVLHLIGDEVSPLSQLLDLYESQVLAFYDPVEHVYYSLDRPPPGVSNLGGLLAEAVVIHEMTHALQDQVFDAGRTIEALRGDWDRQLAYHSVVEGEATLVMFAWMYRSLGRDLSEMMTDDTLVDAMVAATDMNQEATGDAPQYFVATMKFPYVGGLSFVVEAFRRGGWKAVDRLHSDPPQSTEEVLHPEVYFRRREGEEPAAASRPLPGEILAETLGEFHWQFLLGDAPAAGWQSDTVHVLRDRKRRLTVLAETSWDSENDAREFAEAYGAFLKKAGEKVQIRTEGQRVRSGYGPDRKAIRRFVR